MVVQYRQRVAAALSCLKIPLEVHLPQVVGGLMLKVEEGSALGPLLGVCEAMPMENGRDGGGTGNPAFALGQEKGPDLTASPGSVFLPHLEDSLLHLGAGPLGRTMGTPGAVSQSIKPFLSVSPQQLVSGARTNAETAAQLRDVSPVTASQDDKLLAF
jgi:hypothetical protein